MLREIPAGRRDLAGLTRRWYTDADFDLYVFTDAAGGLVELQLCYDKCGTERMLAWHRDRGYAHGRIDDGQDRPGRARTPIIAAAGRCDSGRLAREFVRASLALDDALFDAVYRKLLGFRPDA